MAGTVESEAAPIGGSECGPPWGVEHVPRSVSRCERQARTLAGARAQGRCGIVLTSADGRGIGQDTAACSWAWCQVWWPGWVSTALALTRLEGSRSAADEAAFFGGPRPGTAAVFSRGFLG